MKLKDFVVAGFLKRPFEKKPLHVRVKRIEGPRKERFPLTPTLPKWTSGRHYRVQLELDQKELLLYLRPLSQNGWGIYVLQSYWYQGNVWLKYLGRVSGPRSAEGVVQFVPELLAKLSGKPVELIE